MSAKCHKFCLTSMWPVSSTKTLRARQNGRYLPDNIFKCTFMNENGWTSIMIPLKFVPKGKINNIPALVQIMAWRQSGDESLSEPMMVRLPKHICIIRPQWVRTGRMMQELELCELLCLFTLAHEIFFLLFIYAVMKQLRKLIIQLIDWLTDWLVDWLIGFNTVFNTEKPDDNPPPSWHIIRDRLWITLYNKSKIT